MLVLMRNLETWCLRYLQYIDFFCITITSGAANMSSVSDIYTVSHGDDCVAELIPNVRILGISPKTFPSSGCSPIIDSGYQLLFSKVKR